MTLGPTKGPTVPNQVALYLNAADKLDPLPTPAPYLWTWPATLRFQAAKAAYKRAVQAGWVKDGTPVSRHRLSIMDVDPGVTLIANIPSEAVDLASMVSAIAETIRAVEEALNPPGR